MNITTIKRPWMKERSSYPKTTSDPYYHSQHWKRTRESHINGYTQVGAYSLSNRFCIQCYEETGKHNAMHTVDHPIPLKEGGSKDQPLRSLCKHHNAVKTAQDGNRQRYGIKKG